jgi:chromosome segregation ATPase
MESKSSVELFNEAVEKEIELNKLCDQKDEMEKILNNLGVEMDTLKRKKTEVKNHMLDLRVSIRKMKTDHTILNNQAWKAQRGGL